MAKATDSKHAKALSWDDIQGNASTFSKRWQHGHDEKSEAQSFVRDFLAVFGVHDAAAVGTFEERAKRDRDASGEAGRGFMDYFWPKKIAIEMKTLGKDLAGAYKQLKDYVIHREAEEMPDLLMVSDFATIILYRRMTGEKITFKTKDLRKYVRHFALIAGYETTRMYDDQQEVNVKAAEKMAKLHDELKAHGYAGHELEVFLVRLMFCLFADDTGIFPQDSFVNFIENSQKDGGDLSLRLSRLFEVLNMPDEMRAKRNLLTPDILQFRYINGGLFAGMLPSADFDGKMRETLLDCAKFDWSAISPAIFGAMFQGVMDEARRRELGAHYTSEENILKLINPLFMDELWAEFEKVKSDPKMLDRFHEKISKLKFLDPACGCGNFLIITYRELRRLELEILRMKAGATGVLDLSLLLTVNVGQFYGIEYEDFPCQIAQAGMWLMDHQMNMRASDMFGQYMVRLPLRESATIVQGNALRLDWETVVPKNELSYILGNPPFVGKKEQTKEQKNDLVAVFSNQKGVGVLDYVTAWYRKAASFIAEIDIKVAFVSTNSISQGEQPSVLWKTLLDTVKIDFAYRTFKWSNDAKGKAAVHCVIIGFSLRTTTTSKYIYADGESIRANNINPYLVDAPDVLIENRTTPICDVPQMYYGSMPIDKGALILSEDERSLCLHEAPETAKFIRSYIGGDELLNNTKRYCIWLTEATPKEIRSLPQLLQRIAECKKFREKSERAQTKALADTPHLFGEIRQPDCEMLVIPKVSSENRKYIPIALVSPDIIVNGSALFIPNPSKYHFGVLSSYAHNAWMRAICGRLEMRYQYSNNIVYNNFPWPEVDEKQKAAIEEAAQGILDSRAKFLARDGQSGSSLADLYDPLTMPPELLKAHQTLDRLVLKSYGFAKSDPDEPTIVAELLKRYQMIAKPL